MSAEEDGHAPAGADAVLLQALRELHGRAGEPSSRSLAARIGDISHSTVNSTLRGPKVASWPILAKVVVGLGGDEEQFRALWLRAKAQGATSSLPTPAATSSAEVSVFVSYARIDDKATFGRISQVVDSVANTYQSLTGSRVAIFQDTDSIKLGENWRDRIRLGLSSSSVFLAFVSPAYLLSPACREELAEFIAFLDVNSSVRLVIPLIFADLRRLENKFADDVLWLEINTRNRLVISALRTADPGTSGWVSNIELIVDRVEEVLSSEEVGQVEPLAAAQAGLISPSSDGSVNVSEVGDLDRLAAMEESGPDLVPHIERVAALLAAFGEAASAVAPRMQKADSFGKKLAISRGLAADLEPIAVEMNEAVMEMHNGLDVWDKGIRSIVTMLRKRPQELEDPRVVEFVTIIRKMATTSETSLASLEGFSTAIGGAMGFSAALDVPLKRMRTTVLSLAELRGVFSSWLDDLNTLDG